MQRHSVTACCLVVLMLASTVAATVPAAATAPAPAPESAATTAQPSTQSVATADGASNRTYEDTAFIAVDDAGDGAVVVGGATGLGNPNGTVMRVGADGGVDWSTGFESQQSTRVVDVVVADGDDVYALLSKRPRQQDAGPRAGSVALVRLTADGDVTWRQSIDTAVLFTAGASMVESDDGVAVAHQTNADGERGVRLAEYASGDAIWEHTYDADASPSSLRKTDDGYLLSGTVNYDVPWVVRTTESGRPRLNVTLDGVTTDRVVDAVPTGDGGAVVVGEHRTAFSDGGLMPWTARVDGDGRTRWTRVHDTAADAQVQRVLETDSGLLLVGQNPLVPSAERSMQFLGVGMDGATLFSERVGGSFSFSAVTRTGDSLTAAGITEYDTSGITSAIETYPIPAASGTADAELDPDVGVTSNETVYRGQDVRITDPGSPGESYDLVRLPNEYDEFEPHAVRRVTLDGSETTVIETALLPDGDYVLRATDGQPVALDDGRITGPAPRDEAEFTVRTQHFFRVETNRTFVNVATGDSGVSLSFDSERTGYDAYLGIARSTGGSVDADAIRATFGDRDGFVGVERLDGDPVARIEMGSRDRLNVSAAALGPGLYEVTVSGVDTRDGGAVATGRLVVGNDTERRLGLTLGNRTLTVPAGDEVTTNVTLTNVTNGISAMSMSANRTGQPAVMLNANLRIDASQASASAGMSRREATTAATAFQGHTGNGTVRVGSLGVEAEDFGREPITNGTNTVSFRVDWVVDEDGIPYALPDETTVTVQVVDAGNASDGEASDGGVSDGQASGVSSGGQAGGASSGSE